MLEVAQTELLSVPELTCIQYTMTAKSMVWGDLFAMHLGEWPFLHRGAKAAQQNEG